jgi:hypothetical protein
MNKYVMLFLFSLMCNFSFGQEKLIKVAAPKEVSVEVVKYQGIPKELEGLRWNRWTSKNFVVCSLNDPQAEYLYKHLELVKGWIFNRWGLYDIDLSAQCKLICVDDPTLFKKLFNLDKTKVEIRRDSNGRITETVVFLLIDGPPSLTVPVPLTEVCLSEFAQKFNCEFKPWSMSGMAHINGTIEQIKNKLEYSGKILEAKNLIELNQQDYSKLPEAEKEAFDSTAVFFCLFLRKEFGQDKFLTFLQKNSQGESEDAVKKVLNFNDYNHLNDAFTRYVKDLGAQIKSNKVPDFYLQINEKK